MLVGDLAVAIGHPLTLGAAPTVTTGVVSALERRLDVGGDLMGSSVTLFGLIQTDAPITRGSSGGALINKNGELIGITTAIATADVGAEGLGFAVPINLALNIAEDLIKDGKILHAFLGILGAQHFDTAEDGARIFSGVYIQELYGPGGELFAIGKAGAQPGDVIKTSSENTKLKSWINFKPNTSLEVGISRFAKWYKSYYCRGWRRGTSPRNGCLLHAHTSIRSPN